MTARSDGVGGYAEPLFDSGGVELRVFHIPRKSSRINTLAELAAHPVQLCPKVLDHQPSRVGLQNADERLGLEEPLQGRNQASSVTHSAAMPPEALRRCPLRRERH